MSDVKQPLARKLRLGQAIGATRRMLRAQGRQPEEVTAEAAIRILADESRAGCWRARLITQWYMCATEKELVRFVHGWEYWRMGRES